jgi:hypothetical protein
LAALVILLRQLDAAAETTPVSVPISSLSCHGLQHCHRAFSLSRNSDGSILIVAQQRWHLQGATAKNVKKKKKKKKISYLGGSLSWCETIGRKAT